MSYEEYKKRPIEQIIAEEVQRQLAMETGKQAQMEQL